MRTLLMSLTAAGLLAGCQTNYEELKIMQESVAAHGTDQYTDLRKYKESDHALMAGYFNKLEKTGTSGYEYTNLSNVPDSVDIVDLFLNMSSANKDVWSKKDAIKKDIRLLQAKSTKVVNCVWLNDFDGYKHADGTPYQDNEKDYALFADSLYTYFSEWGLDGIDIDMEPNIIYPKAKSLGLLRAISKHFGPKSGNNNLFIFDTDQTRGDVAAIFDSTHENYSYVFFQSYNCPGDAWYGNQSALAKVMDQYGGKIGKKKFLVFTNGEKSCAWEKSSIFGGNRAALLEYADWCKKTGAGGVGVYGINYDYNNNNYANVRAAISLLSH